MVLYSKISRFSTSQRKGDRTLKASSAVIGKRWVWFEAAVLSCSWRRDDILESISLFLFVGATLVEFRGAPCVVVIMLLGLNYIDFCTAVGEMTLLFVLSWRTVFKWSLRLY